MFRSLLLNPLNLFFNLFETYTGFTDHRESLASLLHLLNGDQTAYRHLLLFSKVFPASQGFNPVLKHVSFDVFPPALCISEPDFLSKN
jgi:hypothetical protein